MGRPPMTPSSSQTPLPSPVDDRYLASGTQQPEGTISTNQFLHQNMKLIGILWKILLRIYRSDDGNSAEESTSAPESFNAIMDLDRSLEDFKASLPTVFAWGSSNVQNTDHTFRRQSNVLHARYAHRTYDMITSLIAFPQILTFKIAFVSPGIQRLHLRCRL